MELIILLLLFYFSFKNKKECICNPPAIQERDNSVPFEILKQNAIFNTRFRLILFGIFLIIFVLPIVILNNSLLVYLISFILVILVIWRIYLPLWKLQKKERMQRKLSENSVRNFLNYQNNKY